MRDCDECKECVKLAVEYRVYNLLVQCTFCDIERVNE